MSELLHIDNITVNASLSYGASNNLGSETARQAKEEVGVEILRDLSLDIGEGETHVLLGPNGAGKSTLGYTLIGSPEYVVTGGSVFFDGQDITHESADKRAKMGMFMSFQTPVEIPGISLSEFIKAAIRQRTGRL